MDKKKRLFKETIRKYIEPMNVSHVATRATICARSKLFLLEHARLFIDQVKYYLPSPKYYYRILEDYNHIFHDDYISDDEIQEICSFIDYDPKKVVSLKPHIFMLVASRGQLTRSDLCKLTGKSYYIISGTVRFMIIDGTISAHTAHKWKYPLLRLGEGRNDSNNTGGVVGAPR